MADVINADWSDVKDFINARASSPQWIIANGGYYIYVFDGPFGLSCFIPVDGTSEIDFETNFKSKGNKSIVAASAVQSTPPIGAKTIVIGGVTKRLFARTTGMQYAVVTGSNTLTYTATYPWVKVLGVECIGTEALDTVDFKVFDTETGTYSGVPNLMLNQFAYTANLPTGFYSRVSQFDADLYQGMIIQLTYVSKSTKTIGLNIIMNEVKS